MKMWNDKEIVYNKEADILNNIDKEIEDISKRTGVGFLILEKDKENFIQCMCIDQDYEYTFALEKKENGKHYNCMSTKLSVQRFFKKWLKNESYKVIKYWQIGPFDFDI